MQKIINGWKPLIIFAKISILHVWLDLATPQKPNNLFLSICFITRRKERRCVLIIRIFETAFYINKNICNYRTNWIVNSSLLNRVGCVVTWVTCVRGLRGSAGAWVAWIILYTWVAWVKFFCMRQKFFVWVFAWVKIFYVDPKFLRWSTFIYQTRLFYYTSTNGLENFLASPFPTNPD